MNTTTDIARADVVRRLYDAECALHAAHQSRLDAWIASASDRLHDALVDYLAETATDRS